MVHAKHAILSSENILGHQDGASYGDLPETTRLAALTTISGVQYGVSAGNRQFHFSKRDSLSLSANRRRAQLNLQQTKDPRKHATMRRAVVLFQLQICTK